MSKFYLTMTSYLITSQRIKNCLKENLQVRIDESIIVVVVIVGNYFTIIPRLSAATTHIIYPCNTKLQVFYHYIDIGRCLTLTMRGANGGCIQ